MAGNVALRAKICKASHMTRNQSQASLDGLCQKSGGLCEDERQTRQARLDEILWRRFS
jgi:hypothetical protein